MLTKIGRRIKNIRQLKGYTQEDLAERANLSLTCISRLENEKSMVSIEKLWTIAKTLDTDLRTLPEDKVLSLYSSAAFISYPHVSHKVSLSWSMCPPRQVLQ